LGRAEGAEEEEEEENEKFVRYTEKLPERVTFCCSSRLLSFLLRFSIHSDKNLTPTHVLFVVGRLVFRFFWRLIGAKNAALSVSFRIFYPMSSAFIKRETRPECQLAFRFL